ncbi:hypothetical protein NTD89_13865, partial [Pseudomonas sp. 14P_5.3_Bac1]|uniref:hypothetical protein n=1 Tax=Pseudomonas sp. 14P_5.3_Bac1 TaxID=2971622 RepID=UPI0021C7099E
LPALGLCMSPEGLAVSQSSQASQLPQLDLCTSAANEAISDNIWGCPAISFLVWKGHNEKARRVLRS